MDLYNERQYEDILNRASEKDGARRSDKDNARRRLF